VLVRGGTGIEPLVAVYANEDRIVVGALVVDDPRTLMKCRKAVASRARFDTLDLGLRATAAGGGGPAGRRLPAP
jgi:hypothetical protein